MDFPEMVSIVGWLFSLVGAIIAFLGTRWRIKIERDLEQELHSKLMQHSHLLKKLSEAETDEKIKGEIQAHHDVYFAIISSAIDELPSSKRRKVEIALAQRSKKGSASYMYKLLKNSLKSLTVSHS